MKKLIITFLIAVALFFTQTSHAIVATQAAQSQIITAQTIKPAIFKDFNKMSTKERKTQLGRKCSWKEKFSFNMSKLTPSDGNWWLGFALGFSLGFVGVILAYQVLKAGRKTINGSWWGLGVGFVLTISFIVILFLLLGNSFKLIHILGMLFR